MNLRLFDTFMLRGPNPGGNEETSQFSNHRLPGLILGMGPVEDFSNVIQGDPQARALAFGQFSSQCKEQRFDVMPIDVGANGVREDPVEGPLLFLGH
jgi:hypothetical protein